MKKLMIAAAIVCAAALSQAATVSWNYQATYIRIGDTTNTKIADGTKGYLIDSSKCSLTAIVEAFATAGNEAATIAAAGDAVYTGTGSSASGKFDTTASTSSAATAAGNAYFVLFNGDRMWVSSAQDIDVNPLNTAAGTIEFAGAAADSKPVGWDADGGYKGTGWYQAAAVPEPTSGLLLLLGVAGLALRRRRA